MGDCQHSSEGGSRFRLAVMNKIKIQVYTHNYKAKLLVEALQEKIRHDPHKFDRLFDNK